MLLAPVVFIGGKLVGGLERLMAKHIAGELVPVLKQAGALTPVLGEMSMLALNVRGHDLTRQQRIRRDLRHIGAYLDEEAGDARRSAPR
ncbi:hypothetical protein QYE76_017419 [Lolium multiflorum]|uniref:Uncharacterized protein n=1 Tax=Lolium multiflorum TaxID=4521 RepID=A0AAD8VFS4_LOLMU|nr:hypothetical protein QYE76_017419 [Lolium multiflorum]